MVINKMILTNELKIKTKLNKLFFEIDRKDRYSEEEIKSLPEVAIMDKTNVIMIIAKTEESKIIMAPFIKRNRMSNIPTIVYDGSYTSSYNVDYMIKILQILGITFESCKISMSKDFPMTLENDSFKFFLAPRVSNE